MLEVVEVLEIQLVELLDLVVEEQEEMLLVERELQVQLILVVAAVEVLLRQVLRDQDQEVVMVVQES